MIFNEGCLLFQGYKMKISFVTQKNYFNILKPNAYFNVFRTVAYEALKKI
jgi:hypothetical protein